jgi:hypothetical protein
MKCIQRGKGRMLKVSNTVAKRMVEQEGYHYVNREAHKAQQEQLRNGTYEGKSVEEK